MTIRELGDGECSTFAFEKRSQAALGNIKQAYIALVCTDFALWKGERPFTGQKESLPDHTENFNLPVKVYLLIFNL